MNTIYLSFTCMQIHIIHICTKYKDLKYIQCKQNGQYLVFKYVQKYNLIKCITFANYKI